VISKLLEEGLYPYTKRYLGKFDNHFSTIGVVGLNEACLNAKWLKKDLTHPEAQEFTKDVLNHMRDRLSDYQEKYGDLYNLEATPAESTSFRLAKHDKKRFGDIISASENGTPYYTNSSHLPVSFTDDIFSALDIQDELQTLYTSGTVFHAFLGEKLPDWKSAAALVRKISDNYKLPYYTLSPVYSICRNHGYIAGEKFSCPECGEKTEVYSRITGYYRPVQNWNDGKLQEYKDRKVYDVKNAAKYEEFEANCQNTGNISTAKEKYTNIILFTSANCPNCKIAKKFLDEANMKYEVVIADIDVDKAVQYGIRQAPTLIADNEKFVGLSEIRIFINKYS
jgi:ribonucleoside-triphosphate reductase